MRHVWMKIVIIICYFAGMSHAKARVLIRVCDGPSCTSSNSFAVAEKLDATVTAKEEYSALFEVGFVSCLSACKRSCNVSVVPRGSMGGVVVEGMTPTEKTKPAFCNVEASNACVDRILSLCYEKFKDTSRGHT